MDYTPLLKEWAVVCQALSEGLQIVIIRKGGLLDEDGLFHVAHSQFYLFPAYLHQDRFSIKPRYQSLFDRMPPEETSKRVIPLSLWAQVVSQSYIRDWQKLQALDPFHIWTENFLRQRFQWGGKQGLFFLTLRIYRRQVPYSLPLKPKYAGCKSWVTSEKVIPASPLTPIISDSEFLKRQEQLKRILLC